nr:MAG TPA: hypothetical protein [Caudoviricetes sp.]
MSIAYKKLFLINNLFINRLLILLLSFTHQSILLNFYNQILSQIYR